MNKQQLANKIWESANKMRSKIEANEYKDYILGFIFYKFLSDKEERYLISQGWDNDSLPEVTEDDVEIVEDVQKSIGYFIGYDNLFSTWLNKGHDFNVSDVHDALSAFARLVDPQHKKVFDKIFDTLQTGLSKLGDSSGAQTKAISDLIHLIKDIPMDGKQDYDVLGFIYEYLISNFAANAGKKAGEFYTPHEVSLLMSEIVADHLKDKTEIEIFDPTSGSGSLLINIGNSVAKHMGNTDRIKYYAQELKENTYNLTRMNLVMRGILPSNIFTRNGDTLEEDWPYFEENDPVGTYHPLYVDAVVSNPPYSQHWSPDGKENDPRYKSFGLAPKSKADYAFLLHDLYHIKPDGIMTIVLPHGVLFRGGEEGVIRKNLIEKNNIDAVIGLPANIFFGTGIPTIIMVLKQKRDNTDVLIIDASKGFVKIGKNNKLRASDIKRITDTYIARKSIDKFSKVVSRDEIRANDYNLNIPRYVDSSEKPESWDIYASMFGGIPSEEVEDLSEYWDAFPKLKEAVFSDISGEYLHISAEDIKATIVEHPDIKTYIDKYKTSLTGFDEHLYASLVENISTLNISKQEAALSDELFRRLSGIELVDLYDAYQSLDNEWNSIAVDLEILQTEGFDAVRIVDPNMVMKKKNGKDVEVQEGWLGHVIPFELVQSRCFIDELLKIRSIESRIADISATYEEFIDSMSDEDKQKLLNNENDSFSTKAICEALYDIFADITSPEISVLEMYNSVGKKEKIALVNSHPEIDWDTMEMTKSGTYSKSSVTEYITLLKSQKDFPDGSYEYIVISVNNMFAEEKELKKKLKEKQFSLHLKTKSAIEALTDEQAKELLRMKWVEPIMASLTAIPDRIVADLTSKLVALSKKYEITFSEIEDEIEKTSDALCVMIDDLIGSDFDMQGLNELKALLGGCAE